MPTPQGRTGLWFKQEKDFLLVAVLLDLPRDKETLANNPSLQQLRAIISPLLDSHFDHGMLAIAPDGISLASILGYKHRLKFLFQR